MMVENCSSFFFPRPTLPGLMRYLASASAQAGVVDQQAMAVVMKVADQRDVDALSRQPVADLRHGGRRLPRC
jgi:hypothetical protein